MAQKCASIIKKRGFLLFLVLLFSAAVRLFHLGEQSLWVDEIASMIGADPEKSWSEVITYSVSDQPPAFFLLLHAWFKIFPYTDFSGRLLCALLGVLGVLSMFFLGREIKDKNAGMTAAIIASISFILILFSQEVRFYTLLFLVSSLSYLFFIKAIKRNNIQDFIFYALFTSAALYTHYFGLVLFATQGLLFLVIVIFYPSTKHFIFLSIASAVAIMISIFPWIPIFFSDAQTTSFWIQAEPWYFPIVYFYVYFKDAISCLAFSFSILLFVFTLYQKFKKHPRLEPVDIILVGSVVFSFLIPIIYSAIQTPLLQVRYTLIVMPMIIIIISLGIDQMPSRVRNVLLIATCCSSILSLVLIERFYTTIKKEDWKGMITAVIKDAAPGDAFVSAKAWYCNYYFKSLRSDIRCVLPEQLDAMPEPPKSIWWLDGFNVPKEPSATEQLLIDRGFISVKNEEYFRTRATHYFAR